MKISEKQTLQVFPLETASRRTRNVVAPRRVLFELQNFRFRLHCESHETDRFEKLQSAQLKLCWMELGESRTSSDRSTGSNWRPSEIKERFGIQRLSSLHIAHHAQNSDAVAREERRTYQSEASLAPDTNRKYRKPSTLGRCHATSALGNERNHHRAETQNRTQRKFFDFGSKYIFACHLRRNKRLKLKATQCARWTRWSSWRSCTLHTSSQIRRTFRTTWFRQCCTCSRALS